MRTVSTILALVLFGPVSGAEPVRFEVTNKIPPAIVVTNRIPAAPVVQAAPAVAAPRPFSVTATMPATTAPYAAVVNMSSPVGPAPGIITGATVRPIRRLWQSGNTNCASG